MHLLRRGQSTIVRHRPRQTEGLGWERDQLNEIFRIRIEGPPFKQWDPINAVGPQWTDKMRRVDTSGHSASRKHRQVTESLTRQ